MEVVKQALTKIKLPHDSEHKLSVLQNPDLEPMPQDRRTWGFWSFSGYWGVLNLSIWTWSVGSSLLSLGLNIQHSMGVVTVGNVLIVLYSVYNAAPGQVYHIGYTVSQRFIFGIYGSGLGIVIRILISVVYYGSQAWLGGLCFVVIFSSFSEGYLNMSNTFPDSVNMTTRDFIGFLVFHIISIPFFFIKPERMNSLVNLSCVWTLIAMVAMFAYLLHINGGPGPIFHEKVQLSSSQTGWMWLYGMTTWYGALSPDITNIADFSRFSSSDKKMKLGIFFGIFFTEIVPLAGLISASCCKQLYGIEYWLPTDICLQWMQDNYTPKVRASCFFLGIAFLSSELSLNLVTNGFAGGMDLAGVFPEYINITRGSIITALLSWVVQPWKFYNTSSTFLAVMSSLGVVVTPIMAIIISDFILVRKKRLALNDLYSTSKDGKFYFTYGVNWRAMGVFLVTVAPGLPGIAQMATPESVKLGGSIINFFYGSIIFSFFPPLVLYYVIAVYVFPIKDLSYESEDTFGSFTQDECAKLNMIPHEGVIQEVIALSEFDKEGGITGSSLSKLDTDISSVKKGIAYETSTEVF